MDIKFNQTDSPSLNTRITVRGAPSRTGSRPPPSRAHLPVAPAIVATSTVVVGTIVGGWATKIWEQCRSAMRTAVSASW